MVDSIISLFARESSALSSGESRSLPVWEASEEEALQGEYDFHAKAEEVAASKGLVVSLPLPNELQIDLDSEADYNEFLRRLGFLSEIMDLSEPLVTPSASGLPHRHVRLRVMNTHELEPWKRLALQAALGDDPIRHFLNVRRMIVNHSDPVRLFETHEVFATLPQPEEAPKIFSGEEDEEIPW